MLRFRVLLGLLAAIALVIGGAPVSASANPCVPCPANCPTMAQAAQTAQTAPGAKAASDHQVQAPAKGGEAGSPCKSSLACQSVVVAALVPQAAAEIAWLAEAADHDRVGQLAAPSRSPDPGLRPPIQL